MDADAAMAADVVQERHEQNRQHVEYCFDDVRVVDRIAGGAEGSQAVR